MTGPLLPGSRGTSILRCYAKNEWTPEHWDRCSNCVDGVVTDENPPRRCTMCDGYGSLHAAALEEAAGAVFVDGAWWKGGRQEPPRCEDCGHPMSEGAWEPDAPKPAVADWLFGHPYDNGYALVTDLAAGNEPALSSGRVHFSPCDEGCRHGGPRQWQTWGDGGWHEASDSIEVCNGVFMRASWRQVDVRRLSWDHDLRPEYLAVLCMRCWASRS